MAFFKLRIPEMGLDSLNRLKPGTCETSLFEHRMSLRGPSCLEMLSFLMCTFVTASKPDFRDALDVELDFTGRACLN